MGRALRACVILVVAAVLAAGCTVKKSTPPALTGPSEFGLSLSLAANPDLISQDGHSQSVITIQARDANGAPVQNLVLRLDMAVNGVVGDIGSLTTKSPVTASDGRAVVTYTSPSVADQLSRTVEILVTPVGTNAGNSSSPRSVEIRLVPTGSVQPPNDLLAGFTVTPESPAVSQSALFNAAPCAASDSTGCTRGSIVSYAWDFGDGGTGSGQVASHVFARPGSFAVTLTVTGALGQTAVTTQIVQVAGGVAPTADFVFSPTAPLVGQEIYFNASASKPGIGRTIVNYEWDFGTGARGVGALVKNTYSAAGTYVVTLLVTDDVGQQATKSQSVTVK
jgi:PKD repeat protein